MRYLYCVISFLIVIAFISFESSDAIDSNVLVNEIKLNPDAIASMIEKFGAGQTVRKLYGNRELWNNLLKRIASGKPEWLQVAVDLKPGSDAGASEMLNLAVGEALENAPDLVLNITASQYRLEDICSAPDVDDERYSTYKKALDAVRRRISALEDVGAKEPRGSYCVQKLKESIPHLQHFFGVDTGHNRGRP